MEVRKTEVVKVDNYEEAIVLRDGIKKLKEESMSKAEMLEISEILDSFNERENVGKFVEQIITHSLDQHPDI